MQLNVSNAEVVPAQPQMGAPQMGAPQMGAPQMGMSQMMAPPTTQVGHAAVTRVLSFSRVGALDGGRKEEGYSFVSIHVLCLSTCVCRAATVDRCLLGSRRAPTVDRCLLGSRLEPAGCAWKHVMNQLKIEQCPERLSALRLEAYARTKDSVVARSVNGLWALLNHAVVGGLQPCAGISQRILAGVCCGCPLAATRDCR